jgi:hypothetical protein
MLTAACQKPGGKGKALGLHSTVFLDRGDGNTRLSCENDRKNTENRSQLRKFGYVILSEAKNLSSHALQS